jgi:hypothetical protein
MGERVSVRQVEVTVDACPVGVRGLTVRVSGGPGVEGPGTRPERRLPALPPEHDDELADPGGCEF